MKTSEQYSNEIHRLGRLGSLITLILLYGIPFIICAVFDIFPSFAQFMAVSAGLLTLFIPIAISEVISYTPILGSASYLTFITGNIMNLKLPCAKNGMDIAEAAPGTEKGDIIATLAVGVSSMFTIVIIALGVVLLVPLEPILSAPSVKLATGYMMPALFGGLALGLLKSGGDVEVKGRLKATIIPVIIVVCVSLFVMPLTGLEGVALLVIIPVTILSAKILHKKGQIKVVHKNKKTENESKI